MGKDWLRSAVPLKYNQAGVHGHKSLEMDLTKRLATLNSPSTVNGAPLTGV